MRRESQKAKTPQTQTAAQRIRGRTLQKVRARKLRENPLCGRCAEKGIVREAMELDHILALVNGGSNDDDNFQGLCRQCHADKTAEDLGHRVRKSVGLDGWPEGYK